MRHARGGSWLLWLAALCCAAVLAPATSWAQHHHGQSWRDGAYGQGRVYPAPGYRVLAPPPRSRVVIYGGVNYRFSQGVWYAPRRGAYWVVRPPYGVVVTELPAFATVLTVGAATYWYVNDVYYRRAPASAGYEVVPPPDKVFIYPRQGQSADQQASDEYDCHRWAVSQSGYDPSANATGATGAPGTRADSSRRDDYARAQSACLEGRGYTLR